MFWNHHHKIHIRTSILANFLFGIALVAATLLALELYFIYQTVGQATEREFARTAERISFEWKLRGRLTRETLSTLALIPGLSHLESESERNAVTAIFADQLQRSPNNYALYIGWSDGTLFEVVDLNSFGGLHRHYNAPPKARWLRIRVWMRSDSKRIRRFEFLDKNLRLLKSREEPTDFRTESRSWFRQALQTDGIVVSRPYQFQFLQRRGVTYSKRIGTKSVLGVDITIDYVNTLLKSMKFDPTAKLMLFDRDGERLAETDGWDPAVFQKLLAAANSSDKIQDFKIDHKGTELMATVTPLGKGRRTWIGITVETRSVMRPYLQRIVISMLVAGLVLFVSYFLIAHLVRRIVTPIHELMDENEKIKERRFNEVRLVETDIIELDQLSHSLYDLAESIQAYQKRQEALLDGFIFLIADAIDAKSPYTGGHCRRVPVIAERLLQELTRSDAASFADFRMEGGEAWEEFRRAAWLHDCGKITTPEYVVDKATKLETIYNRIHEIRTRFEVLWRDEEIRYLRGVLEGGDSEALARKRERAQAELIDDFDFVARVNLGGEFLSEEHRERIHRIARRRWLRHFDKRLGLSEVERERMEGETVALPAEEFLLADRPEHRIPRLRRELPGKEETFTLQPPELLYNRGELHNLCVQRGTLTPEEYYKIQEHVIMTIRMLEELPWPEEMRRIPEYAGNHHERLDGRGYPRSLRAEALSIPSRVMAIADVFEALTASDRPYKRGKTLASSLEIMVSMARGGHLDGEVLALFIRSGLYREYGERYLKEHQLGEVDEEELLKKLEEKA